MIEQRAIVLTGKRNRIAQLMQRFPGKRLIALPLLEIHDKYRPEDPEIIRLLQLIKTIKYPVGAAFSTSGVHALMRIEQVHQTKLINTIGWCAVGKRTATMLENDFHAMRIICKSPDNTGAGLANAMLDILKNSLNSVLDSDPFEIIAITAERGRPEFFEIMQTAGIKVHRFALYCTKARQPTASELNELPDRAWICFGSPGAVQAFFLSRQIPENNWLYASIGSTTTQAIQMAGHTVTYQASSADYGELIQELPGLNADS